ncbi:hypothetical protein [Acidithiobacillus thiooxidans]|uniref:hypothetical protein n=1 Tax=Acidithiobacillus thiooxidans TaxID=930 RepID=UPI0009DA22BB|nr:hypothetical protein [Acidithiobacillus thiooxidans]
MNLPFILLSFGVEKALLLFSTTSATLSVLAANHYPNKWFIFFVFMTDSVMFLGILFIPLISNKMHEITKNILSKICSRMRHAFDFLTMVSNLYGPAKKDKESSDNKQ